MSRNWVVITSFWRMRVEKSVPNEHDDGSNTAIVSKTAAAGESGKKGSSDLPDEESEGVDDDGEDIDKADGRSTSWGSRTDGFTP